MQTESALLHHHTPELVHPAPSSSYLATDRHLGSSPRAGNRVEQEQITLSNTVWAKTDKYGEKKARLRSKPYFKPLILEQHQTNASSSFLSFPNGKVGIIYSIISVKWA